MEKLKLTGSGSRAFGPARLYWREGAPLRISLAYRGAYGLGERFDALNQKGRRAVCEVEEKFCFQGGKTYCPAPFFWTDSRQISTGRACTLRRRENIPSSYV